jgi:hypothetical protein
MFRFLRSIHQDSKMAARGRKQKACLLQWNLGETLETHLAGKTTEKRQNFDPSTHPAGAENLHFTSNGETRRAPRPPVTRAQMAYEDKDKFCSTLCIPFDETTTEQHLKHHLQDWRLRQTPKPKLLRLKLHCIWTWRVLFFLFSIFHFVLFYLYICNFHLLIFYFYSYLYSFHFLFSILSLSL